MSDFIPPRMEHVIVDEETQMLRYLAEIAMEDLLLAGGKRTERPGGLMAQYKRMAAIEHASEGDGVAGFEEIDGSATVGLGAVVMRPVIVELVLDKGRDISAGDCPKG